MAMRNDSGGVERNRARPRKPGRYAARLRTTTPPTQRPNDLPYQEMGAFVRGLRLEHGTVARALEFIVLTVCRIEEACHAAWHEFDLTARIWTLPAGRTKSGTAHRIALSDDAIAVLEQVRGLDATWVFPGIGMERARHLAFRGVLERLGRPASAVRGGRAAFRDWALERTPYAETKTSVALCLGHAVEGEVSSAVYRHPDRFDGCRTLMAQWAQWCATVQPD